jgi:hypothetical protein
VRLIIVHSHFRPGGVRRVIEVATPWLVRVLRPRISEVVLAAGEGPERSWLRDFKASLRPARVKCRTNGALAYLSEQRGGMRRITAEMRAFLDSVLHPSGNSRHLVWAHNQGLGRNFILARELERACGRNQALLVLHHHDWWFDNRWERWREVRRAGLASLDEVAEVVFCSMPHVRHAAINQADAALLERHLSRQAGWVPNLAPLRGKIPAAASRRASLWLGEQLGEDAPIWLMPCRLLRRKNIAEALLLTRWLRPEAWLVTTAGVSSADERAYAQRLSRAAQANQWRLRLSLLDGARKGTPSVPELMAASEALLLTSLQEGFGLPYLEAATLGRPLICRALENIMPDLAQFGLQFEQAYPEIMIAPALFDWPTELARQERLFSCWREELPAGCREWAEEPPVLRSARQRGPVPFSRLTLTAQLEVLQAPVNESWSLCRPLNAFLKPWRLRAGRGALSQTRWPESAERFLGGRAYGETFQRLLEAGPAAELATGAPVNAQRDFIRERLASGNLYPLYWDART